MVFIFQAMKNIDLKTIEDLKKGKIEAFEQIFHAYYAILLRYCKEYVIREDIAKEIIQDVFMILWERRQKLKPNTKIHAYLFTITRNSALNYLKRKIAEINYLDYQKNQYIRYELNYYALRDQASEKLFHKELLENVQQTISELPPKCKEIFLLSRDEGLKYKEIAGKLNISEKTVENHIAKALRMIRKDIREYLI